MRPLEYVHGRLWIVTHGVHENSRQESHQGQTHLVERNSTLNAGRESIKLNFTVIKHIYSNTPTAPSVEFTYTLSLQLVRYGVN